jgi:hypothetical protein
MTNVVGFLSKLMGAGLIVTNYAINLISAGYCLQNHHSTAGYGMQKQPFSEHDFFIILRTEQ